LEKRIENTAGGFPVYSPGDGSEGEPANSSDYPSEPEFIRWKGREKPWDCSTAKSRKRSSSSRVTSHFIVRSARGIVSGKGRVN